MTTAHRIDYRADPHLQDMIREIEDQAENSAAPATLDRRGFLKIGGIAGGGLVLAFTLSGAAGFARAGEEAAAETGTFAPNAFLRVSPDGGILLYAKGPDMGQGIKTAFPMIIAEELDADWADVTVEQAPVKPEIYGFQSAGGSTSIPRAWDQLRRAGAVGRAMLIAAAAKTWGVPEAECRTEQGTVIHVPSDKRLGYGALAETAAALSVPDAESLPLKKREDYTLLGTRVGGVDNHAIVTGQPLYGVDQVLPDMVYAAYQKCPKTGGRVKSANLDHVRSLPGVADAFVIEGNGTVTELMPGVAIIAETTWAAFEAKKALKVEWDESAASTDTWDDLVARAQETAKKPPEETIAESGDVDGAFDGAVRTVESFYSYPFLAHAALEPQNCTAWYRDGGIEIWAPTQTADRALKTIGTLLDLPREKITIHQTRVGGAFGRRLMNDYMCEVAAIAKRVGKPVKLQWTREDDMAHDFYRPGGFHALKGAVDDAGKLAAWQDHFVTFTADGEGPVRGGGIRPPEFPNPLVNNYRLAQSMLPLSTPCGYWRAPGSNAIAFVVQSFLHELSSAAGRDHAEFLLEIMGEPRWLQPDNPWALNTGRAVDVIKLVCEKAGWGRSLPEGRGLGLAFHFSHAGHFAEVADVSVDSSRKVTIHGVTVAGDIGPVVNLSGAENQCEGAVLDGLSAMAGQQVTMTSGRIRENNFDQYPLLRIDQAPEVTVHFIQSDFSPTGVGEPALPPAAPAVCNAIYTITGHRLRSLPISKEGFTL